VKKAIIVTVSGKNEGRVRELIALSETLGYTIVKVFSQNREKPDPRFFLGKGKFMELVEYVKNLQEKENGDITIIFDGSLKPIQFFNIYKNLRNINVLDRVQLILEIFEEHAGTREAKLQIELARLKHIRPIIKEWIRQRKIGELPGFLGSGRYDIDAYYLMIKRRITKITRDLEKLRKLREKLRKSRKKAGISTVAIVGYTSAGKTSLFNALTGMQRKIGEEPFTTLSPKHRAIYLDNEIKVLVMDTVGFIDYVPIEIIEAFYSTLEEITESSLIILVIDISETLKEIVRKISGVFETLEKVGVSGKPMIVAFNKIDLVMNRDELVRKTKFLKDILSKRYENIVAYVNISAKKRIGIEELVHKMSEVLSKELVKIVAKIPENKLGNIMLPVKIVERHNGFYICEIHVFKENVGLALKRLMKNNVQLITH